MFPFSYLGTNYSTCIEQESPSGKAWCATRVDDDGNYIGKWGYCEETTCGVQGCPSNQRCVAESMCQEIKDLSTTRDYKIKHGENLDEINRELNKFQTCEGDKICCSSILVGGMRESELARQPFLDLKRIFANAGTAEKGLIIESVDTEKKRQLLESTRPEVKQYILSNYPNIFAQTVERFTWERREQQENFTKTIDSIVKKNIQDGCQLCRELFW